ncbi:hypothetical protein G6F51_013674 [Rhizopus arrhizus]|uniref:Uncharacterized protein n=1 Tax=Rhizopus oryzae TaxID=64495 RepID=A0A9P7C180_RHIOR|nr:hypothetical protein G6F51_013674 [Rhizopus arrhizus]
MNIPKDAFCTVPESIIHLPTEKGKIVNHKQYPIAYKLKPVLDEAINKWLDNGTITKAPVNTAWNSPLTLADKKDANGNKTGKRPCLDPRHTVVDKTGAQNFFSAFNYHYLLMVIAIAMKLY